MNVIIAGSRTIDDYAFIERAVETSNFLIKRVISGGARGVDKQGELWAKNHGIPCTVYRADWEQFGKRAGAKRNRQMADVADALIAVWTGSSPGTRDMIEVMEARGKLIHIEMVR